MTFAPVGIKCPDHAGGSVPTTPGRAQVRRIPVRRSIPRVSARPVGTTALVALNIAVFLVTVGLGSGLSSPGGDLYERGSLVGILVGSGEWWRLVTAVFLHAGVVHLAFNMLALWFLGSAMEQALGTRRFLLLYLVSGLAGSAGAILLTDPFAYTVGASGAIFGTMGALIVLEYLATGTLAGQAMGLLVVNLAITFTIPSISKGGHLGGLVGGVAAGYALMRLERRRRGLGVVLAIGVAVLSVAIAWWRVRSYDL